MKEQTIEELAQEIVLLKDRLKNLKEILGNKMREIKEKTKDSRGRWCLSREGTAKIANAQKKRWAKYREEIKK